MVPPDWSDSPQGTKDVRATGAPTEVDWSQAKYIPLPPSPPSWEVDGRDACHRECNEPEIGLVVQAGPFLATDSVHSSDVARINL